jgi:hypothetical protein
VIPEICPRRNIVISFKELSPTINQKICAGFFHGLLEKLEKGKGRNLQIHMYYFRNL